MAEDVDSPNKVYLGGISMEEEERKAMLLGRTRFIPREPLFIPIKYQAGEEISDFLNLRLPLCSDKLRNLLDETAKARVFYREAFLVWEESCYPYYYMMPPCYNGLDRKFSALELDERLPGGVRVQEGGFYVRSDLVHDNDIFRLEGFSNRRFIVSERLKRICEDHGICGVTFIETSKYKDQAGIKVG